MRAFFVCLLLVAACEQHPRSVVRLPPAPSARPARLGATLPSDLWSQPADGPFPTLADYCAHVDARRGNDAPRFCDADPALAQHARLTHPVAPIRDARFVAHDDGGDFVFCSLGIQLVRGWYVLSGFECKNTMNDDRYDFRVTDLASNASGGSIVVRATANMIGDAWTYESRCGVGPSGVPRCVSLVTREGGRGTGVQFDGDFLVLGAQAEDGLRSPDGLLPKTPAGRYAIVFP